MRKPFAAMMTLVLILGGILPGVLSVSSQTASAYAPPSPTLPAPTSPSVEPDQAGQSLPTPPAPDDLPPEVEETRARQAIEAVLEKHLRYWGPRYQVAPVGVRVEGEWAYGVAQWQSQARTLEEPIHILAHRSADGTWRALMPGSDGLYLQWVDAVPESLVLAGEKGQLRAQATEADALRQRQASSSVPPTVPGISPSKEGPSEPIEHISGPTQPIATPVPSVDDQRQSYSLEDPPFLWAPNTSKLLYRQLNLAPTGPGGSPYDLWLFDAQSGVRRSIISDSNAWRPAYTVDGQVVQFWKEGVPYQANIANIDRITLNAIPTAHHPIKGEFSPDGSQLLYITSEGEMRFHQIETGEERVLGTLPTLAQPGALWPEWSPDGNYIAFLSGGYAYLLSVNASSLNELYTLGEVPEPQGELSPDLHYLRWSADSASLFSYRGDVFVVQPSTASQPGLPRQSSSDGGFTAYVQAGEVFIHNTITRSTEQLTNNQAVILRGQRNEAVSNSMAVAAVADGFDFPVGKPDGSGYHHGEQPGGNDGWDFLEWTGDVYHPGEDWNKDCGGDCDLGDPVYAVANGTVIDSNYYAQSWGNVILIEHVLPDGSKVWSQSAHLRDRLVGSGKEVSKGEQIGTIGKGAGDIYWAHLHFEIRIQYRSASAWVTGWSQDWILQYYTDPTDYINNHRQIGSTCSAPSLNSPSDGYIHTSSDRTITFNWSPPSNCTPDGYTFRVKTVPDMDSGGDTVFDEGQGGTQVTKQFGSQWDNRDLYWSIRACKPCTPFNPGPWAPSRRFRIEPSTPSCNPGAGQIALFVDADYHGQCVVKNIGEYPNPNSIGLPNDSISSVKVGGNVRAVLCRDDNYQGGCETFTSDDPDLGNNSIGNDQVSSVKVEPRCSLNADQIALFVDPNYGGQCVVKNIGEYPNPSSIGLPNDSISSLKVGGNVRAVLCRDDNYGGGCETFTSDDPDLGNNSIGNDQVSSVKVEQRIQPPSPPSLLSPANGAVLNEGQEIVLSWSATGNEYYGEVWGGPGGTLTFGWQGPTSKNIGAQWAGYTYSWHVKARNSAGESGWSSTRTFTVRPAAPSNLSAQAVSCHQVNLYWTDNSSNEEGYRIYRNGSQVGQVGMNATSYQDDSLNENTSYSYYIRAFRGTIQSDLSNTVSVQTPPCVVKPDLRPYAPPGYPYPVVPSSVQGTHEVNTLYAGQPTYFDWHFINGGNAVAPGTFYVELWVDDYRVLRYPQPDFSPGQVGGFDDWAHTVTIPGWHTVRLITDPDDTVDGSDENNNVWEHLFYWTPCAPYADNMENGTNDWGATGLWHQVGPGSPYRESHSDSHSWWYGRDATGNYDTGAANSGDLTSPPIYIPSAGYYLRFWYRYETETHGQAYDQRWVQISVDGGPFNDVLQLYDDPKNWWLQSPAINLSGYAGHAVRVRFHFHTIDDTFNDYRGWYIDDFEINTTPPPSCADSHEPNNTAAQATAIAYGQTLSADICPGGDYDFYRFTGTTGDKVVVDIDAKVNGSSLDSYVFLLDSNGTSVLAEHDDEITYERQDSHLSHQLPHNGTYYIKVRAWNHPSVGGTDHFYTIRLLTDNTSPSVQITSPAHDAWLNPDQQTVTTAVSDSESGIRNAEFYWHDANWDGSSDWIVLNDDWDAGDGWTYQLDTSSISEQSQGCVVFIYAYDWAGNYAGYGSYHLGIDRTLPVGVAGVLPMYGDAPFRDFYVYWWDSHDNLSGIASYDVQYRDGTSGTWTDLLTNTDDTYTRFVGFDGHTYYFRTRARDSAGNQSAYASGNGDVQHKVEICYTPPDAYEVDDTRTNARWIIPDAPMQVRSFYAQGDRDWVRFYAAAGITYTLMTTNTGGHSDTVLYLYDRDGTTLITSNDDAPDRWPASRIDWQPSTGGFYWAKIEHWDPWAYGCTTGYGLSITGSRPTPFSQVYLPLMVRDLDPSPSPPTAVETLNFRVSFYGRDNGADEPQNVPIKVTVMNLALDHVLFESGWVAVTPASGSDNWGIASVDVTSAGLASGQYYQVFVRGAMHLAKRAAVLLAEGMTIDYTDADLNPDAVLWTCDVNQDNQVNREDMTRIVSYYGQTAPTTPDPSSELYRSDQNGDGVVNVYDWGICIYSYGKVGDPY